MDLSRSVTMNKINNTDNSCISIDLDITGDLNKTSDFDNENSNPRFNMN